MTRSDVTPIPGYRAQSEAALQLVRANKELEERVLRLLDMLRDDPAVKVDPRWLALGRSGIEQGFMAVNRAIMQPGRVELSGDDV
ncbi:DUF7681 family protein [Halodurantibacterium flavum]|uniref:Cyclic nucleotide-binding protein n=1 Tax=Halodurantibacterium flavum TaxID=1382802 RepID=A0ABW4SAN9_9RHOB